MLWLLAVRCHIDSYCRHVHVDRSASAIVVGEEEESDDDDQGHQEDAGNNARAAATTARYNCFAVSHLKLLHFLVELPTDGRALWFQQHGEEVGSLVS